MLNLKVLDSNNVEFKRFR